MGFLQNIFHNRSIKRLRQMLEALRMGDFSLQYSLDKLRGEERLMAQEINNVINEFRIQEHNRVRESHFYEAMHDTINSMLIATDESYKVRWMNKAAIEGLCGFRIDSIDKLAALFPTFPEEIKCLKKGCSRLISHTHDDGTECQYMATMTPFFTKGMAYRLYTIDRVDNILQEVEVLSQQRLIRVLTHEIMNSLAPIISLSGTLVGGIDTDDENMRIGREDELMALQAINRRAEGLLDFVRNYRAISAVPKPMVEPVAVGKLVNDIKDLQDYAAKESTAFIVNCPEQVISVDRGQIEQVVINLLKNSREAGSIKTQFVADVSPDNRWLVITVTDNGCGFLPDAVERLFVPFYSTKQGGQGIGLSVCRQIITNHGGTITALNRTGSTGAIFRVQLPL